MKRSAKLKIVSIILSLAAIAGFLISFYTIDKGLFNDSAKIMVVSWAAFFASFVISEDSRSEEE